MTEEKHEEGTPIIKAGDGGPVFIKGGDGCADHDGGDVVITGDGGPVFIRGGDGGSIVLPAPSPEASDDSPWVPAAKLWKGSKLSSCKEVKAFRQQHPEMFRNPSPYKLEIHAALWARYWAEQEAASFEGMGGQPSIADDPEVSRKFLAEAVERAKVLRAKKKTGKQAS